MGLRTRLSSYMQNHDQGNNIASSELSPTFLFFFFFGGGGGYICVVHLFFLLQTLLKRQGLFHFLPDYKLTTEQNGDRNEALLSCGS